MSIFSMKKIIFIACVVSSFFSDAAIVVNINKGIMKPVSIALNLFDSTNSVKDKFLKVIKNDLQSTYLFQAISEDAFMQPLRGVNELPKFPLWKAINAQYLANSEIKIEQNKMVVSLILYDVASEIKVGTISVSGDAKEWRKIAHLISNSIYERVTGEKGYFDTKILYVSVQKTYGRKTHRLAIMDQDGYDHKFLTDGRTIVLTPRFSPNGKEFSFFSYREKIVNGRRIPLSASVYRYDLMQKRTELIAQFKGMTYAPRYSPDGSLLIFSLSNYGSSSIYTFDLVTRRTTRLTRGRCIDTSPCYSPDGKYIVFNSDRGGTQQLYIMDADGANIRRLSFSKGRYATPVWSPRGDWIAFTKFGSEGFYIGIIHPDGTGERMLTSGNLVEGPTWSPNGRVVMFSHQDYSRKEKIFSVDITGYNKHEIATPNNAIDPEWSGKRGLF
ncbi:MAG: Tol-Pal system beta propeller repeat protein TolB [Holosporaceae bacterium]|jgi:TolB protein|nr:Tol-Pal system beta propeller repeat protein TolB [Holosporaceae bacterium]